MKNILFLSANPSGTTELSIKTEIQEIRNNIPLFRHQDGPIIHPYLSLKPTSFYKSILRSPAADIIHFSGHGHPEHGIILDSEGDKKFDFVSPKMLGSLFSSLKKIKHLNIKCVILNSCYSKDQAQEISNYVPYVVGTTSSISDKDAIQFSSSFYEGMIYSDGEIPFAFEYGRNMLMLKYSLDEHNKIPLIFLDNSARLNKIDMQQNTLSPENLIRKAKSSVKQSINNAEQASQQLEDQIDSIHKDIFEWFASDKAKLAKKTTNQIFEFKSTTQKDDFIFELTCLLELIEVCLVTERTNVLITPQIDDSFPKEMYIQALKHINNRLPDSMFAPKSIAFLKTCFNFLADRL